MEALNKKCEDISYWSNLFDHQQLGIVPLQLYTSGKVMESHISIFGLS